MFENFTNWFESIWTKFEKDMKEIGNRKRKEEKRKNNRKGPRGNRSAWSQKRPTAQLDKSRTGTYHSLSR
jgi:hypothetical protein